MNKVIILSIQPRWLEKILNGEKTIEIRKSMPKCDYPIDVYLYCTYGQLLVWDNDDILGFCGHYLAGEKVNSKRGYGNQANGKIVAKFTLNKVDKINNCGSCFEIANESYAYTNAIGNRSCLDFNDMKKYLNNGNGYAWHIDNLEIFDKPMELREFYRNNFDEDEAKHCNCGKHCEYEDYDLQEHCGICNIDYDGANCPFVRVQRPPQSWCYAYLEE